VLQDWYQNLKLHAAQLSQRLKELEAESAKEKYFEVAAQCLEQRKKLFPTPDFQSIKKLFRKIEQVRETIFKLQDQEMTPSSFTALRKAMIRHKKCCNELWRLFWKYIPSLIVEDAEEADKSFSTLCRLFHLNIADQPDQENVIIVGIREENEITDSKQSPIMKPHNGNYSELEEKIRPVEGPARLMLPSDINKEINDASKTFKKSLEYLQTEITEVQAFDSKRNQLFKSVESSLARFKQQERNSIESCWFASALAWLKGRKAFEEETLFYRARVQKLVE